MRRLLLLCASIGYAADPAQEFVQSIRPVLVENCGGCHNPNSKNPANFLKASTAKDIDADRGLWRSVAIQLRNRTMPPVASKLAEADRLHVSRWIDGQLRQTACSAGEFAGSGAVRRLNRREYRNTVRDLLGVDLDVTGLFPADGTGGAGFDTNGDTLYIQPLLMERYLQAAQQILDRVIVTPRLLRSFPASKAALPIYLDGEYEVRAAAGGAVKVDGADAGTLVQRGARGGKNPPVFVGTVRMERGTHTVEVSGSNEFTIEERRAESSPERRALHYRLLGSESGEPPLRPRQAAQQVLAVFLPKAFRRPARQEEVERYLAMFDRAAERGDPYEECIKLALKAVMVSPDFLFRMEERKSQPGIYPLNQYELASRLSYFLWSTMPDSTLLRLAEQGRLQDPQVLSAQVERMLDDPRSRTFTNSFIGQWLGTQEIGGRFMPVLTETLSYYTVDIAADLKMQPVLLLDRIVGENRSILELLTADYMYLTQRLAKYYGLESQMGGVNDNAFHLVTLPDNRRAGILGLAGVLGMTSHYEQTSPVLRGAWVLDTLLGTPVPPPPPDVPPLDTGDKAMAKLSVREKVLQHRANTACAACHRLMDPIGFGLEHFDWMGRWRDTEAGGQPIDATGELPSGEKFDGAVELRAVLLKQKDEFMRQFTGKVLGYALGRSLQDGDSCTVQRLVDAVAKDGYRARTLLRGVALSLPFRNTQGGLVNAVPADAPRLNLSSVTSRSQDAKGHNNGEPLRKK